MGSQHAGTIVFEHVDKWYGAQQVLADIDLVVDRGEVIAIVGPSGSGKSTLVRCINGLESIDNGRIRVSGRAIEYTASSLTQLRQEVGMVFQAFHLYPHMTALENVTLAPINVKRMSRERANAAARTLLERVGLAGKEHAYPAQLSGGQQQRVAIARALAMEPAIMLLDEPTSALDPEMVSEVLDVISALAREGITMLCVTHEMAFAREIAGRVIFMDAGRILEVAPPETFFSSPCHPRARNFLAKLLRSTHP